MNCKKSNALWKNAKKIIPGGTQLLSKRPEMFAPGSWPPYFSRAKGVAVWDLDGNKYIDMSILGVGACVLGYADREVDSAVKKAIDNGITTTLNCPEDVVLAELLCKLHPWAEMVRYARSGGEAVSVAVRIARAATGRDKIAFSGYHGWCDWYLSANLGGKDSLDGQLMPGLEPAGVPRCLKGTALPFHYNNLEELDAIVSEHGNELAAIVMEPVRGEEPKPGFLETVRKFASSTGAVLIFDEITSGFRMNTGGIHLRFGIKPDMVVFAKSMANGYAMAAVIGKMDVMNAAQSSFISSTNWSERIGPVAALATIKKFDRENVGRHLIAIGEKIKNGWKEAATEVGLNIHVIGILPLSYFLFQYENDLAISTLFTQEMLKLGFLAWNQFKSSYAHTNNHLKKYLENTRIVFTEIAKAIVDGQVEKKLAGPVAKRGFYRLTR